MTDPTGDAPETDDSTEDTGVDGSAATDAGETEAAAEPTRGRRGEPDLAALEREGEIAADYLEELLDIADLDGDIDMDVERDRAAVSVVGGDLDHLVGDEGFVLEALQELTRLAVLTQTGERSRLMLDVAGYRAGRRAVLTELGRTTAEQVKSSGEPSRLEAMTPFERKIVHDAVAAAGLRSESEGEEPQRRVVVHCPHEHPRMTDVSRETSDSAGPGSPVTPTPGTELPAAPPAAAAVFGNRLDAAIDYARMLATEGVIRGLLGPREVPRLWERHLLNCAVVAELVPPGRNRDRRGVGCGPTRYPARAGPARPGARAARTLGPPGGFPAGSRVRHSGSTGPASCAAAPRMHGAATSGRHRDRARGRTACPDWRRWCLPLLRPGGSLIALKGSQASAELASAVDDLRRLGAVDWEIVSCGARPR